MARKKPCQTLNGEFDSLGTNLLPRKLRIFELTECENLIHTKHLQKNVICSPDLSCYLKYVSLMLEICSVEQHIFLKTNDLVELKKSLTFCLDTPINKKSNDFPSVKPILYCKEIGWK